MDNVIIFHHADIDGATSAFLIKNMYKNKLHNKEYTDSIVSFACGRSVKYVLNFFIETVKDNIRTDMDNVIYMLDYAIEPYKDMISFYDWIISQDYKFVWVDHHASAIEAVKNNIPCTYCAKNMCGAKLTYNMIYPNTDNNTFIEIVNDYDLFKVNSTLGWDNYVMPIISFLNLMNFNINSDTSEIMIALQNCFDGNFEQYNYIGEFLFKQMKNIYNKNKRRIKEIEWNDMDCLVINSSLTGSEQFCEHRDTIEYDLLIVWNYDGNRYYISVYTNKSNINVGDICTMYLNGGGRKDSGGGNLKNLPEEFNVNKKRGNRE